MYRICQLFQNYWKNAQSQEDKSNIISSILRQLRIKHSNPSKRLKVSRILDQLVEISKEKEMTEASQRSDVQKIQTVKCPGFNLAVLHSPGGYQVAKH